MSATLLSLLVAHIFADFVFQSQTMATAKKRSTHRGPGHAPWWMWLLAHGSVHGFAVTYVTGSVPLGIAETVCHSLIDLGKCEGKYGIYADQFLHLSCKVAWAWIMVNA